MHLFIKLTTLTDIQRKGERYQKNALDTSEDAAPTKRATSTATAPSIARRGHGSTVTIIWNLINQIFDKMKY
jgi:hypothetical protein